MEVPQGIAALITETTVLKRSTTTSDGNVAGTTLIDSGLTEATDDYWSGTVVILSGACKGQKRDIASFTALTDTITVGSAFASQIVSGVEYAIVAFEPATVEVAALQADVGDASAGTLGSLYAILGNPSHSLAATILDGIDARTNNSNLNALLGVPDDAGKSVQGNIGDFQAQTNLQTLLAALGIPDTLNKPLYTCLITDRLDHATYGLSALNTYIWDKDISAYAGAKAGTYLKTLYDDWLNGGRLDLILDAIQADTIYIADGALPASPTANSLARFIASGGTALGTPLPDSKSLYDGLSGGISAVNRVAGKTQVLSVSVTSAANAASDTVLATCTTQPCIVESVIIRANAAQTGDLTSCPIFGCAGKVITFIGAGDATQANLDATSKQISWSGSVYLNTGETIVMEHNGTGATALDLTVIIKYRAVVNNGYLA